MKYYVVVTGPDEDSEPSYMTTVEATSAMGAAKLVSKEYPSDHEADYYIHRSEPVVIEARKVERVVFTVASGEKA